MSTHSDGGLYHDPKLAQFYDLANKRGRPDFDYCKTLANDATSVLDLGCGTGELAAALVKDRAVTGLDPAAAMLDIARQRPGGERVAWLQADARSVRLDDRFDLVLLTGHAFQVFLTNDDQRAVLLTIAAHLTPGGKFIFDSRNPAFKAPKSRDPGSNLRQFDHPQLGQIEAWNESTYDEHTNTLTYENGYRVLNTGKAFSAFEQIRYTPQEELAAMLAAAGLVVDKWLGDWEGSPYQPDAKEIIPIGHLA